MPILTWANSRRLPEVAVPARLKRISKVTLGFAIFQVGGGLTLGAVTHLFPSLQVIGTVLRGTHVVCALAILAQASSIATAYDMQEEKEFETGGSMR